MSKQLTQSTAVVGGLTLASRMLGFVRDLVVAQAFGATAATDAFFVAFKIPNFLRRLFAEGAFAQSLVPVLSDYKENRTPSDLRDFLDRTGGTLAGLAGITTFLGLVAAPLLILLVAPGFAGAGPQFDLAVELLRITFPYLFFIALTAYASGILNAFGRFAVPAFTPVILNLCLIAAALGLAPHLAEPVAALAWGVCLAGALQYLFQLPALGRLGLLPRWRWGWRDAGVRRVLGLMGPAVFGVSVTQINLFLNTILASLLPTGSVSWLYYADRLLEFPVGLFGVALGTAVLPALSRSHALGRAESFSAALDWALRWVVVIGLPASVGLVVLAEPIMSALFEYREFTAQDAHMAGRALAAYSIGLAGFVAVKVLVPGYSARHEASTTVRYGLWAVGVNLLASLVLFPFLAHAGLALATALAALLNAGLLLHGLRRSNIYGPRPGWGGILARVVLASAVMAGLLCVLVARAPWPEWPRPDRLSALLAWIGSAMAIYGLMLWASGFRFRQLPLYTHP